MEQNTAKLEDYKRIYPEKFLPEEKIFSHINRGDRIFIGTACSEPQYLVNALVEYVKSYPKAFFDTEVIHVWTLGVAPYADEKFKQNFRHNSFFIGMNTRNAVNKGIADYTPIFLSRVPQLLRNGIIDIDVALVQTSYPDEHGYLSLGVSVDIVKTAVESARLVVVQVNKQMPRVHGDAFIHIKDVDFIVPHDEEILEFTTKDSDDISNRIGKYVSLIIQDGDTIQVGYGRMPNAILKHLISKKNLGVHTELISDGIVELMKAGVVTNSEKTVDRGKTIASFCMGTKPTYEYIHDNPSIEFKTIDYTNNPIIIAQQRRMTAINAALQIDLTGQATAESLGKSFFSGIGGQADFMRGAILAPGGKSILTLRSTTEDEQTSRIVPFIPEGAGITLNRGDVHYVVTEYGIAYIHGKNIRERAMDLIAIAHPKFRPWLIEEAKKDGLIYRDQAFIPGKKGEYPEHLETYRTTKTGIKLFLRPVKISDEELLKDFFYSLSDQSLYRRFISTRKDMPHERLQEMVVIDYTKELVILAVVEQNGKEVVVGVGQYGIQEYQHWAEVAFAVRDDYQYKGIGQVLLSYLTLIAKRNGLLGFTAEVLVENKPMLHLFEKMGFNIEKRSSAGVYELKMEFRGDEQ
ncbi:MAG: GNAT family N-acetyltransferase [Spirochaetes bacterium]|nr:GNAT family N-acetyltransferase [Spirochaetota bacterium]MBP8986216.1 GNAT family N-acetyltransferase [Spirochaetota bacterium]